ncbi:hypothetical protein TL16_g00453 [Triparma laevis f. inornata]|uniref:Uncharacterized protein n=1 Tax=Triparma laevis f. inornata TaxID=1714386 RepID=A0A9W6Z836_9STRA|nr:hypothetical protein TL16_g00453 [Triparma laevis f. inornata]
MPPVSTVLTAPFMSQVKLGSRLVPLLDDSARSSEVSEILNAQLSTSDGIRGFFVSYLTAETPPTAPVNVPKILKSAMETTSNPVELIDLSIMNVIMPKAQASEFLRLKGLEDADYDGPMEGSNNSMMKSSEMTAKRGKAVVEVLMGFEGEVWERTRAQFESVRRVAKGEEDGGEEDERWKIFFEKWGYEEHQRSAIAKVSDEIL